MDNSSTMKRKHKELHASITLIGASTGNKKKKDNEYYHLKLSDNGAENPLLALFPEGPPPKELFADITVPQSRRLNVVNRNEEVSNEQERKLNMKAKGTKSSIMFKGQNYGREYERNNSCYMIGIRKLGSNEINLCPVDSMFVMKQETFSTTVLPPPEGKSASRSENTAEMKSKLRQSLIMKFAASSNKKKLKKFLKSRLTEDSLVGDNHQSSELVDEMEIGDDMLTGKSLALERPDLPLMDLDTWNITEVYNLKDHVPLSTDDDIQDELYIKQWKIIREVVLGKKSLENLGEWVPEVGASIIMNINPDAEDLERQCKLFLYLLQLIHFYICTKTMRMPLWNVRKVMTLSDKRVFSESRATKILQHFARMSDNLEGAYKVDTTFEQKLIRHICILFLVCNQYQVSISSVSKQLQIPFNLMKLHFIQVGCSIEVLNVGPPSGTSTMDSYAKLKAPLRLPQNIPTRLGKKKRK